MIKAKERFYFNGVIYEKGDEVKVETVEEVNKLNEKGFIEPLTNKQLQNFGKEPKKNKQKEEE